MYIITLVYVSLDCFNYIFYVLKEVLKEVFILNVYGNRKLFKSGVDTSSEPIQGVCFFVHAKHNSSAIDFRAISGRLPLFKQRGKNNNTAHIPCYTLTESRLEEESEESYADIQALIDSTPKGDNMFATGDFNAKIGNLPLTESEVVDPYNNIIRGKNERSNTLISFYKQSRFF